MKILWVLSIVSLWLVCMNVGYCFDGHNPFKKKYELEIPPLESYLNETYQVGIETVLQLWWRQRWHISKVNHLRKNISLQFEDSIIKIRPFDDLVNHTEDFIQNEVLVLQDILWGERKEKRDPLNTSMFDKYEEQLEGLQVSFDEKKFPRILTENEEKITGDVCDIRETLNNAKEGLKNWVLAVKQAMEKTEEKGDRKIKPFRWIQIRN